MNDKVIKLVIELAQRVAMRRRCRLGDVSVIEVIEEARREKRAIQLALADMGELGPWSNSPYRT